MPMICIVFLIKILLPLVWYIYLIVFFQHTYFMLTLCPHLFSMPSVESGSWKGMYYGLASVFSCRIGMDGNKEQSHVWSLLDVT